MSKTLRNLSYDVLPIKLESFTSFVQSTIKTEKNIVVVGKE